LDESVIFDLLIALGSFEIANLVIEIVAREFDLLAIELGVRDPDQGCACSSGVHQSGGMILDPDGSDHAGNVLFEVCD
jgi:hypothetical protein